jgi:sporulation protein YlmC with PRC-barrel domain
VPLGKRLAAARESRCAAAGADTIMVLTGDELGEVDDVEFDSESGTVEALIFADGRIAGADPIGVGSHAVVVAPS